MNLFEINDAVRLATQRLFESVDENGELDQDAFDAFQNINEERDTVIENIALVIKTEAAMVDALKNEKDCIDKRLKTHINRVEWLKSYLSSAMDGQKFESARVRIGFRKSDTVVIDNIDALPEQFLRTKTTIDADKTALKEAFKNGEVVAGAHIESMSNIQIK